MNTSILINENKDDMSENSIDKKKLDIIIAKQREKEKLMIFKKVNYNTWKMVCKDEGFQG